MCDGIRRVAEANLSSGMSEECGFRVPFFGVSCRSFCCHRFRGGKMSTRMLGVRFGVYPRYCSTNISKACKPLLCGWYSLCYCWSGKVLRFFYYHVCVCMASCNHCGLRCFFVPSGEFMLLHVCVCSVGGWSAVAKLSRSRGCVRILSHVFGFGRAARATRPCIHALRRQGPPVFCFVLFLSITP